jgi:hypothetical protein
VKNSMGAQWTAEITPTPAGVLRLPGDQGSLIELVWSRAVALRGWNYPHVPHDGPRQGVTSVPSGIEAVTDSGPRYQETWQLGRDGSFTHKWRAREDGSQAYAGTINVIAAVRTVTEVFEFGRNLHERDSTVESVMFDIALEGMLGRPVSGDFLRDPFDGQQAQQDFTRHRVSLPRADLPAGVPEAATTAACDLFANLGYAVPRQLVEREVVAFRAPLGYPRG